MAAAAAEGDGFPGFEGGSGDPAAMPSPAAMATRRRPGRGAFEDSAAKAPPPRRASARRARARAPRRRLIRPHSGGGVPGGHRGEAPGASEDARGARRRRVRRWVFALLHGAGRRWRFRKTRCAARARSSAKTRRPSRLERPRPRACSPRGREGGGDFRGRHAPRGGDVRRRRFGGNPPGFRLGGGVGGCSRARARERVLHGGREGGGDFRGRHAPRGGDVRRRRFGGNPPGLRLRRGALPPPSRRFDRSVAAPRRRR